jgi:hypothetical protein
LSSFEPESFYVPSSQEAGTYAQAAIVWFTAYDFTIDFAAVNGPLETGSQAQVVSRVRIPAALAFDLIRTINEAMGRYEAKWGEIHRPEDREPGDQR